MQIRSENGSVAELENAYPGGYMCPLYRKLIEFNHLWHLHQSPNVRIWQTVPSVTTIFKGCDLFLFPFPDPLGIKTHRRCLLQENIQLRRFWDAAQDVQESQDCTTKCGAGA